MPFLFEIFIGKYASIAAGIFGVFGSLALAVPPIQNASLRDVLFQLEELEGGVGKESNADAKRFLLKKARELLSAERLFNLVGAGLLVLSFLVLLANSVYTAPASQTASKLMLLGSAPGKQEVAAVVAAQRRNNV